LDAELLLDICIALFGYLYRSSVGVLSSLRLSGRCQRWSATIDVRVTQKRVCVVTIAAEYITSAASSSKQAENERRRNSQPACRVRNCRSTWARRRSSYCSHCTLHSSLDNK
jgi:hypothetical protein